MNARARLMHEVKIAPRALTTKQARKVDSLRCGLVRAGSQWFDERTEGTVAIKLMRPGPQDLTAVGELRQTRINQGGLSDPRLTLDQHDPPATRPCALNGLPQDRELALPAEDLPPHCTGSYSRNSRAELPPRSATPRHVTTAPTSAILARMPSRVILFSTDACTFCAHAKSLLMKRGVAFEEVNLGPHPELQAELAEVTGLNSFPQIIVDGEPLGGLNELRAADGSGALAAWSHDAPPGEQEDRATAQRGRGERSR
jgi:glutaredoxin 3